MDLKTALELYGDSEDDYSPVALDESVYNPDNCEFKATLRSLQQEARKVADKMPPRHARIVRTSLAHNTYQQTADILNVSAATVSKAVKSPNGQKLLSLLRHIQTMLQGTTALEREHMLWRIAVRTEITQPKTAITAISTINAMKTDHEAAQQRINDRDFKDVPQDTTIKVEFVTPNDNNNTNIIELSPEKVISNDDT